MKLSRRSLLAAAAAPLAGCGMELTPPEPVETAYGRDWNLRYAPRMGLLGDEVSFDEHLEIYAEYGFKAFEYNAFTRRFTLKEAEEARKRLGVYGMQMGVFVVNSQGWKGDALVDAKFHDSFLKDLDTAIEYHEVMDNRWSTVTTGLSVDYLSLERQTQNVIDGLKKAADRIGDRDYTLVLEPLNVLVNHPGYHVVTSEHAAQIIDAVDSPRVRILFDIYHQQISEGNLIHNIEKHWDRIGYFQVGDVPGRKEPGTGEIRYQAVFQKIYELGYKGMLGMEHSLSQPGMEGLIRCFEAYREADTWG